MKKIILIIIVLSSSLLKAQELKDTIYTTEGIPISCKITKIQAHWLTYEHLKKNKIKKDNIYIDDVISYTYNGIVNKIPEKKDLKKTYGPSFLNNPTIYYPTLIKPPSPPSLPPLPQMPTLIFPH